MQMNESIDITTPDGIKNVNISQTLYDINSILDLDMNSLNIFNDIFSTNSLAELLKYLKLNNLLAPTNIDIEDNIFVKLTEIDRDVIIDEGLYMGLDYQNYNYSQIVLNIYLSNKLFDLLTHQPFIQVTNSDEYEDISGSGVDTTDNIKFNTNSDLSVGDEDEDIFGREVDTTEVDTTDKIKFSKKSDFSVGDYVDFLPSGGQILSGTITKLSKTMAHITDNYGDRYRMHYYSVWPTDANIHIKICSKYDFNIGDSVYYPTDSLYYPTVNSETMEGVIKRLNRTTATVRDNNGDDLYIQYNTLFKNKK